MHQGHPGRVHNASYIDPENLMFKAAARVLVESTSSGAVQLRERAGGEGNKCRGLKAADCATDPWVNRYQRWPGLQHTGQIADPSMTTTEDAENSKTRFKLCCCSLHSADTVQTLGRVRCDMRG